MEALTAIGVMLLYVGATLKLYHYLNRPKKKVICSTCMHFYSVGGNIRCESHFNKKMTYTFEFVITDYKNPPSEINKNNDCKHYSEVALLGGYQPISINRPPDPPPFRVLSEDVTLPKFFKK